MQVKSYHIPVLVKEVLDNLNLKPNGIYVDCTVGGGGHSLEILKKVPDIKLYCIDQDIDAIRYAKIRLLGFKNQVLFFNENFKNFRNRLALEKINKVDGILMDIGVSNYQISTPERGFSFQYDSQLDMRMDKNSEITAFKIINEYDFEDLVRIFSEYGEERYSKRIAREIISYRQHQLIERTKELSDLIERVNPEKHPVLKSKTKARIFQALRIEVNNELDILNQTLKDAISMLNPHGRLAVISWHSLEDRIVKQFFIDQAGVCTCPNDLPVCMCKRKKRINIITKKPLVPTKEEVIRNSNARSAKLRVAERVALNRLIEE